MDIFFVISGFVITSLLLNEHRSKSYSILTFYERRIRRIFPALFFTMFVSALMALAIFTPSDLQPFSQSVVATTLFLSNVFFWSQAGYFDASADAKPLMHTWSLGVEEQFYLVFPLFLYLVLRWQHQRSAIIILCAAIVSFVTSVYGVATHPSAAFYLAPTRFWELLIGSLLALEFLPELRHRYMRELTSLIGAGFILYAVLTYSNNTPFPGLSALLPCLGAALLIHSGGSGTSVLRSLLNWRPIVFIGLISYSLYLLHWPLIVFFTQYSIDSPTLSERFAIVVLAVAIAAISWKFIEQPFRGNKSVVSAPVLYAASAFAVLASLGFGFAAGAGGGWPERFADASVKLANYAESFDPRRHACQAGEFGEANACLYGANVAPKVALWGDSHAAALAPALGQAAAGHGASIKLFSHLGCLSVVGVRKLRDVYDKCMEHNALIIDLLEQDRSLETVVLASRYAVYLRGYSVELGPAETHELNPILITGADEAAQKEEDRTKVYVAALTETVRRLIAAGKTVVLVYPVPEVGYNVPKTLFKLSLQGGSPESFKRPVSLYRQRNQPVFEALDGLGFSDKIVRLYPHKFLCDELECIAAADGKALYSDDNHLSLEGAAYISAMFEPVFRAEWQPVVEVAGPDAESVN